MLKKFINWFNKDTKVNKIGGFSGPSSKLIPPSPTKINVDGYLVYPPVELKCYKLNPNAIMPSKAHTDLFEDAAYDLYSTEDGL
jgi:hypothetical protein